MSTVTRSSRATHKDILKGLEHKPVSEYFGSFPPPRGEVLAALLGITHVIAAVIVTSTNSKADKLLLAMDLMTGVRYWAGAGCFPPTCSLSPLLQPSAFPA